MTTRVVILKKGSVFIRELVKKIADALSLTFKSNAKDKSLQYDRNYKGAKIFVWIVLFIMFFTSLVFIGRQSAILIKNRALTQDVASLQKQVKETAYKTGNADALGVFADNFIRSYYNTDRDSTEYQDAVKSYMASGVNPPDISDLNGNKKINSLSLWDKRNDGDTTHLVYLVKYTHNWTTETKSGKNTKKESKSEDKEELINFDVANDSGRYSVVTVPYTSAPTNLQADGMQKAGNNLEGKKQVSDAKKTSVQNWLDGTFFERYINSNDLNDVRYLMDAPEVLGGTQKYAGIANISVYKIDGEYVAKVQANTTDSTNGAKSVQDYTIKLTEDGNKYHVKKLTHTLGE